MPSSSADHADRPDPFRKRAEQLLGDIRQRRQERTLAPPPPGTVNLCSNDYLGLLSDQQWQSNLRSRLSRRAGAGASRLLAGELPIFAELEEAFSRFKGAESSLLFATGYAANEALVRTLARLEAHFFSDELNHASLIDGCRLARLSETNLTIYPHGDIAQLRTALESTPQPRKVILTESVFSMDGDTVDLAALHALARQHEALLVVDEAHAIGVFGSSGRGRIDDAGLEPADIVSVNTLGKAFALQGAIVSGPRWLRELLINTARPFIYSTGPSPWVAEAALYTLGELPNWDDRRDRVLQLADRVRCALRGAGFATGNSCSPIIPFIVGAADQALELADQLLQAGCYCRAIRPPTVPPGTCRIRLSLTAAVTDEQIDRLIETLAGWRSS